MPTKSLPSSSPAPANPVRRRISTATGPRSTIGAVALARRRHRITLAKFILPGAALLLLCTIAAWPEVERIEGGARTAIAHITGDITAARVTGATYHSVDAQGRPYTVTAATAQQDGPERVNLTLPKGDITLQNGYLAHGEGKTGRVHAAREPARPVA